MHKASGVKIDTSDLKNHITKKASQIDTYLTKKTSQLGGALPLALIGSLAAKLVSSGAASGLATKLIKNITPYASSIGKSMTNYAKEQAIQMAHSHVDDLTTELHDHSGLKTDVSDLKQKISHYANSLF